MCFHVGTVEAMFRAIGIGYSRSLPSAAALNWVLKDGLGRLSRCIYTASLASAFDTNLKRVRFATSVLFSLSIGVELLTPVFPKYFLLLATIANIAKQISLACYLATSSAVHRSFAIADNVGEVSAKAQIQTVCSDNVGLLLAATFNILFRNNQRELLPIRIGCLIPKRKIPKLSLMTLKSLKDDFYFICLESSNNGSGIRDHGILLCLREGAGTSDVIMGLLQACYIRNGLLLDKSSWDKALEPCDSSDSLLREWFTLMEESKKSATIDLGLFIDKMSGLGWVCRNILLSSQEQARYSFVAD
ncbi:UNVERIFIED_CONTAM: protein root UVB sensitive 4 [Sesamum calycinum]|uniref:Protein root UVB sensitive 4 n=1 Tax=Sesamum calycinum TaxID=2727403 RepID=A0AAW2SWY0_9LAMI